MSLDILSLPWLPPTGPNFRSDLRSLKDSTEFNFDEARRLASTALDLTQLHSLARLLDKHPAESRGASIAISVLSNATTDLIRSALVGTGARYGLRLNVDTPPFGSWATEALDPHSSTNRRDNDFVLLALDHRAFAFNACAGDAAGAKEAVANAVSQLESIVATLVECSGATVIVQTLAPPATNLFGSLEAQTTGTLRWLVDHFNTELLRCHLPGSVILDVNSLAELVGLARWQDPAQWNLGKFAFSQNAVPLYAEWAVRLIAASKGISRKCLVLDLDNTLWGGVIGDDGLEGVVLAQGNAVGEAYLEVQKAALMLRDRGIVLAVSSKNEDQTARLMFREHPEMLLKEEHIAVFQANWQDKASNLEAIAETLNLGIDSLVLLDDNPAEREQVRAALPAVAVPELPDNPDLFASILLSAGYFETIQFTDDDQKRADHYRDNAARRANLGAGTNLEEYLKSLAMQASVSPFDEVGRTRITQLINKTNQFNLTTRRYTESEVIAAETDDDVIDLQIRLQDKFGDNGMISVVIGRILDDQLDIDTWLMSCRVLNRRVEELVLQVLVNIARRRELNTIVGTYRPTDRNAIVEDLYSRLGFTLQSESSGKTHWRLEISEFKESEVPIVLTVSETYLGNSRIAESN